MVGDGKRKNLWTLVISLGICVGWMLCDSIGLEIPPVYTGLLLIVAIIMMVAYVVSNYKRKDN